MAVDPATYISQFDLTKPAASDPKAEGDDNLRHLKTVLQAQFTSLGAAAVTATAAQMNHLVGVTSAVQTQIDTKGAKAGETYTGTHDFSGATVAVATQTAGNSSTRPASTAFVAAAVSALTADSVDLTTSIETGTSVTGLAGSRHVLRNVAATTVTTPASPTVGQRFAVTVRNGLTTNSITYGTEKIMGSATSLSLNTPYASVVLVYTDATDGWVFA